LPGTAAIPVTVREQAGVMVVSPPMEPFPFKGQVEMVVELPVVAIKRGEDSPAGVPGVTATWFQEPEARGEGERGTRVLSDMMV
jgi:hypothetical protein